MEAGGDRMEYFGKDGGKAIITGNAWAVQENNTMRGNRLTVYLGDDKNLAVKPTPATPKVTAPKVEEFEVFQREKESAKSRPADVEEKISNTEKTGEKIFVDVDEEKNTGGKKE